MRRPEMRRSVAVSPYAAPMRHFGGAPSHLYAVWLPAGPAGGAIPQARAVDQGATQSRAVTANAPALTRRAQM